MRRNLKKEIKHSLRKFLACILTIILNVSAFSCSPKFQTVTQKPASEYTLFQDKDGLQVAIEPCLDKNQINDMFAINLLEHNILPVLVVIQNNSNFPMYLNPEKNIALLNQEGLDLMFSDSSEAKSAVVNEATERYIVRGAIVVPLLVVSPLGAIVAALALTKDYESIRNNILEKQLNERIIFHGEPVKGYVFFQFENEETLKDIKAVCLDFDNIRKKEIINFLFYLKDMQEAVISKN